MDDTLTMQSLAAALARAGAGASDGNALLPLGTWFAQLAEPLWQGTTEGLRVAVDESATGGMPGATALQMRLEGALDGGVWVGWESDGEVPLGTDELEAWLGAVGEGLGEAMGAPVSVVPAEQESPPEADAVGFRFIISRPAGETALVALWSGEALAVAARHLAEAAGGTAGGTVGETAGETVEGAAGETAGGAAGGAEPAAEGADAAAVEEEQAAGGADLPGPSADPDPGAEEGTAAASAAGTDSDAAPEAGPGGEETPFAAVPQRGEASPFPSLGEGIAATAAGAGIQAQGEAGGRSGNIDLLLDVPLELTVELGRAQRRIRDILALSPGAIVELDRLAGEPVDVLVNGKPVARAEVVVIDESFGIRITDIMSPAERLERLR